MQSTVLLRDLFIGQNHHREGFRNVFPHFLQYKHPIYREKLVLRIYIIAEILLPTRKVRLINKKEFLEVVLDKYVKAFVVHVNFSKPKVNDDILNSKSLDGFATHQKIHYVDKIS